MLIILRIQILLCVRRVRIRSNSGPHFSAFGLNTERYSVSLQIQSECRKMQTRITQNTDTFYAVKVFREGFNPLQNNWDYFYLLVELSSTASEIELYYYHQNNWMYELLHELPNNLRFSILRNEEVLGTLKNRMQTNESSLVSYLPSRKKN